MARDRGLPRRPDPCRCRRYLVLLRCPASGPLGKQAGGDDGQRPHLGESHRDGRDSDEEVGLGTGEGRFLGSGTILPVFEYLPRVYRRSFRQYDVLPRLIHRWQINGALTTFGTVINQSFGITVYQVCSSVSVTPSPIFSGDHPRHSTEWFLGN